MQEGISMVRIVILGGSGNGTVIASTIEDCRKAGQSIECAGFLNDGDAKAIQGYPVLGGIRDGKWKNLPEDISFIYALSTVKKAYERYQLLKSLEIPIERFATVVHPTAVVSGQADLGRGVAIMPMALVSPGVTIGDHSHLYAQAFVGHDATIGKMAFLSANSHTGGSVIVKNGAHIGIMSTSIERVTIGEYAVVGAGSVVLRDVPDRSIVVGNPARVIRENYMIIRE
jgi:acetyltransferase EpsM